MAVVFPATPAPNQVVTDPVTNATWRWDATGQRWVPAATGAVFVTPAEMDAAIKAAVGAPTYVGTTPPPPLNDPGDLWMDTSQSPPVLNVYDGTNWVLSTTPPTGFVPIAGGAMTGALVVQADVAITGPLGLSFGGSFFNFQWGAAGPGAGAINFFVDGTNNGYLVGSLPGGGYTGITNIRLDGTNSLVAGFYGASTFSWPITFSDRRLKTNIEPANDALTAVNEVPVHQYDLTAPFPDAEAQRWEFGLIADEVEHVVPAAFVPARRSVDRGESFQSLRELPLIATLWRAVQQLSKRVEELEAKA